MNKRVSGGSVQSEANLNPESVMKTRIKNSSFFAVLAGSLGAILATRGTAQTFTTLHSFSARSGPPFARRNSDGVYPYAGLILSGNVLYGTAIAGGSSDDGTVFAVNTDGTGFTTLH